MLLLFTAGVMNLFWVAALAVQVLAKRFYRISEQPPCSVLVVVGLVGPAWVVFALFALAAVTKV